MNKDIGISCYQEDSNTITQNLNAQHKLHIKRILDIYYSKQEEKKLEKEIQSKIELALENALSNVFDSFNKKRSNNNG